MILTEGNVDEQVALKWKFYGTCKDKKNVKWAFYTNSQTQFLLFEKNQKNFGGLKFVSGKENIKGQVVKKLIGEKSE